jgi:hypothetical protein
MRGPFPWRSFLIVAVPLTVCVICAFSGFFGGGGSATPTVNIGATLPATATVIPARRVGETATQRGVAVTLHEVYDPATPRGVRPKVGMRYASLDVSIRSADGGEHPYNPLYARIRTTDGREARATYGETQPEMQSGTLAPGETVRGWLTFEIPSDAQLATFVYEPIDLSGVRITFDLR